jgi:sRNA-binding protein
MPEETQAPAEHLIEQEVQTPVETVPKAGDQQQEQQEPDRPEWLPEKFKSPEDLAKSYTELEKKITNKVPESYDFTVAKEFGLDDIPEDLSKEVTEVFKKSGFSQDQVKTALALYSDQLAKVQSQMANAPRVDLDKEQTALQQQWGNDYAQRIDSVKKYANTLPERVLYQPLVDTAEGIQFLEQLMEGNRMPNPINNTKTSPARDVNTVREEIRNMRMDDKFKLPPGDPVGEAHRQRLYNLYEQLDRLGK